MITFLGTIIFAVIIGIGSLDGRSGLALLGKYTTPGTVGRRARPGPGDRRGGGAAPRGGESQSARGQVSYSGSASSSAQTILPPA